MLAQSDNYQIMIQTQGDTKGVAETEKALKSLGGQTDSNHQSFLKLAGAVAAGEAAFAAIKNVSSDVISFFKSSLDATTNLTKETLSLQRTFGLTAEQGSGLIAVFDRFGLTSEDATKSLGIFEAHMLKAKDATKGHGGEIERLGINVEGANGNLRNMNDVLLEVADKFKNDIPITERAAEAKLLFGRAGMDLIPVLIQGREGIQALTEHAQKMGIILSQDNVDAVRKNMIAQKDMNEAITGVKLTIGNALMPIITAHIQQLLDWVDKHGGVQKIMQEKVIPTLKDVAKHIEDFITSTMHVVEWIGKHKKAVEDILITLGIFFAMFEAVKIATMVSTFATGMGSMVTAIGGVATKMVAMSAAVTAPMIMGGIAVAGALADIYLVAKAVDAVKGAIQAMKDEAHAADALAKSQLDAAQKINDAVNSGKTSMQQAIKLQQGLGLPQTFYKQGSGANTVYTGGYASGGFTGRGGIDEIAGVVHKGEFVVPQSQVDQSTGLPKTQGVTINQTNHVYNDVDFELANRNLGWRLQNA